MIEIRRSRILIFNHNDNLKLKKKLDWELGKWEQSIYNYKFKLINDLDLKYIAIPRFYDPKNILYQTKYDKIIRNDISVYFNKNKSINLNRNVTWHEKENIARVQIEAYNFLMNCTSPLKMINLTTGYGKTFLAIKYFVEKEYIPLIIVNRIELVKQWISGIVKFTNIKEDDILHIKGMKKCMSIIEDKDIIKNKKVFIATYNTLTSLIDMNINLFNRLVQNLRIGIKIFDEAHLEMRRLFLIDSSADIFETLYLTATPARSSREEDKLLKYILPFKSSYSNREERDFYHRIMIIEYRTNPNLDEEYDISNSNKRGFSVYKWSDYIYDKHWELFSNKLMDMIEILDKKKVKKMAILLSQKKDIVRLREDILKKFKLNVGVFADIREFKDNKQLDSDIILTTDKSFVTGIDVKNLKIVINTISYNSPTVAEQVIGRLRYNDEKEILYIDFCDVSFMKIERQKKNRIMLYRKIAKKIILKGEIK